MHADIDVRSVALGRKSAYAHVQSRAMERGAEVLPTCLCIFQFREWGVCGLK